jgi:hypothetical protein
MDGAGVTGQATTGNGLGRCIWELVVRWLHVCIDCRIGRKQVDKERRWLKLKNISLQVKVLVCGGGAAS